MNIFPHLYSTHSLLSIPHHHTTDPSITRSYFLIHMFPTYLMSIYLSTSPTPIPTQVATTGITFAALFSAAYIAKRWGTVSKYTSVATGTRPLDARSIRKNYSFDELLKAAKEVLSSSTAIRALPSLPRSLATLPCLHGDQTLLTRLMSTDSNGGNSGDGFSVDNAAPLTAVKPLRQRSSFITHSLLLFMYSYIVIAISSLPRLHHHIIIILCFHYSLSPYGHVSSTSYNVDITIIPGNNHHILLGRLFFGALLTRCQSEHSLCSKHCNGPFPTFCRFCCLFVVLLVCCLFLFV